jgi:hypothetical protein
MDEHEPTGTHLDQHARTRTRRQTGTKRQRKHIIITLQLERHAYLQQRSNAGNQFLASRILFGGRDERQDQFFVGTNVTLIGRVGSNNLS